MKRLLFSFAVVALSIVTFSSCFKKNYDSPPNLGSTGNSIPTNLTLLQLSQLASAAGTAGRIMGDSTVYGVVIGDDRSGNLYKQIVIQDSTGGMTVLIDQNNLYASYPIGMKIYIKLKGLCIGTYAGLPELGYTQTLTGIAKIPSSLTSGYIVQGSTGNTVTPKHFQLSQISNNVSALFNTLITIDSVEFTTAFAGGKWAQPVTTSSTTQLNLEDCSGKTIVLYNSGYASFQPYLTPTGKGSATVIYSVYNSTPQILMRDTTDFKMKGARCNGSVITTATLITIDSLKKLFYANSANHSDPYTLTSSYKISGIVTMTQSQGALSAGNIVIEDGSFKGIDLYFGSAVSFAVGDSISIDITGGGVSRYKPLTGSLEVKLSSSAASKAVTLGTGISQPPLVMTTAAIAANYASSDLEYVLVKILNPTFTGGTTYGAARNIVDASSTTGIPFYTYSGAPFASQTIPTAPKSVTGILISFSSNPELELRDPAIDVQ